MGALTLLAVVFLSGLVLLYDAKFGKSDRDKKRMLAMIGGGMVVASSAVASFVIFVLMPGLS